VTLILGALGHLIDGEQQEAGGDKQRRGERADPYDCAHSLVTIGIRREKRDPWLPSVDALTAPRERLATELRTHALVIGEVTLSSGRRAEYYVDAKRAILRPAGFLALGELVAAEAARLEASAVGGLTMGADPVACSALAAGADVKAFFVRKERKEHGLQRWVEGPLLDPGERCLIVEDVVTTGGSTVQAIERVREEGLEVAGVVSVLDRLAGGGEAIEAAAGAPYVALTTIDELYPDRPDR
jgi:orotate phosphoribosyltransferase